MSATAAAASTLAELRIGQDVRHLRVTLHLDSPPQPPQKAAGSRGKAAKQRRSKVAGAASSSAPTPSLLCASTADHVRCALSDASGSVIAELRTGDLRALLEQPSAARAVEVGVDGALQLCQGREVFNVSSVRLASASSDPPASLSLAGQLSALLHCRSGSAPGAGVWLLRLVAGELFVLLQPSSPDPDESESRPPYSLLGDGAAAADGPSLQRSARAAMRHATSVREDQFVLLPDVRSAPFLCPIAEQPAGELTVDQSARSRSSPALLTLFCGLLVPAVELAGDEALESTFEREHWCHVARAVTHELHPVWAESLTQILAGLSGWIQRPLADGPNQNIPRPTNGNWASAQVSPLDGSDDDSQGEGEALFDEKGRVLPSAPASSSATAGNGHDAMSDVAGASGSGSGGATTALLSPLPLSAIAAGVGPSAPQSARRLVRDLAASLSRVEETLRRLRAEKEAEDEQEDEDEDEEDGMSDDEDEDGQSRSSAAKDDALAPSVRRPVKGTAPTSAAKLVGGSGQGAAAAAAGDRDAAKVRRLRAQVRTLLGQIESGRRERIPVTVLTGFLGAGKTSLLNHLLGSAHGLRIGVIVNDFSHVNVDAALLHAARPEELVELSNGCICCTLRADLFSSVVELALSGRVDYICVESTGLGEPAPVAATFTFVIDEDSAAAMQSYGLESLQQIARLDCIATVVDSPAVHRALTERMQSPSHAERPQAAAGAAHEDTQVGGRAGPAAAVAAARAALSSIRASEASNKSVQSLLIEQVEFCNVLVLNKADLLQRDQLQLVEEFVRLNNSHAQCVHAQFGRVDPKIIVGSGKFDEQQSLTSPLLSFAAAEWHASLQASRDGPTAHGGGEAAEFGIRSFVYTRRVGFSAARFHALLEAFQHKQPDAHASKKSKQKKHEAAGPAPGGEPRACFQGVMRVKGVFWLGENSAAVGVWQATTPAMPVSITTAGGWLLALSAADCVTSGRELLSLQSRWHPRLADRYTQLVWIGAAAAMDEAAIRAALDQCALTEEEMAAAIAEQEDDDEQEDDEDNDGDLNGRPGAAPQHNHNAKQSVRPQFPLLQKVLDFDADPNAEPTCALQA